MDQISTEKSSLSETAVIETQRTRSETLPINIHLKRSLITVLTGKNFAYMTDYTQCFF